MYSKLGQNAMLNSSFDFYNLVEDALLEHKIKEQRFSKLRLEEKQID